MKRKDIKNGSLYINSFSSFSSKKGIYLKNKPDSVDSGFVVFTNAISDAWTEAPIQYWSRCNDAWGKAWLSDDVKRVVVK